jgi:hypothetical protein
MEMGAFLRVVDQLRVQHLVHTSGARASDRIEVYHDRLREAVVARISSKERTAYHRRLALALEASRLPDGEALSFHWAKAGDKPRAAKFAVAAAHQASEALAFDRAAQCWERALQLTPPDDDNRVRKLRVHLAEALANAGRGAVAALVYERAAEGAPAAEALDLRRRAGEQHLRSGHFDEGVAAIRHVLVQLGLTYPRSPFSALVQLVLLRLWLRVRGTRFRQRDASLIPTRELAKIDVCWSAGYVLGLSDTIYGAVFQARAVRLALRAGEPTRVARALSLSATYRATGDAGSWQPIERHLTMARALADATRDVQSISYAMGNSGIAHYLAGRFRHGLWELDRAAAIFRDKLPGAAWEQATMHLFALGALWYLGDLAEMCRRQPVYARDALDRGDVYAGVGVRLGHPNVVWLVRGNPTAARDDVRQAMGTWSKKGCHLEHVWELLALTNVDLYEGRGADALARIDERWPSMERSMLLRVQAVRVMTLHARARAAVAVAGTKPERSAERERLLRIAARDARRLERGRMGWTLPYARLAQAAVASLRRETERAVVLLREASFMADSAEMALYATVARRRLAERVGGEEAELLREQTDAWMAGQGVVDAGAMTEMLAPGLSP